MKKFIYYSIVYLVYTNFNLYGQVNVVKDFKLIPNPVTYNDSIKLIVEYDYVPGTMQPYSTDTTRNDTIFIVSYINSSIGFPGQLDNYKDTIAIGKLAAGNYLLSHKLFDLGKVYYVGDTILSFTVSNTTGLQEIVNNNMIVNIFPNPGGGNVHLRFNDYLLGNDFDIEIYSADGKLILHRRLIANNYNEILNLNFLENGIYFFKISNGEMSQTQHLIIK
jgi:hypothetical protein